MPLYEYRCDDCDHRFEVLRSLDSGPEGLLCPQCGAEKLAKLYSSFAASAGSKPATLGAAPAGGRAGSRCCRGTPT